MSDNDKKKKQLAELASQMQDEFVEKAKEGDEQALSRAGELAMLKAELEKPQSCQHEWAMDTNDGRLYCIKCGEDGGSPWDC